MVCDLCYITGRLPERDDMHSMVYCVATIQEIQRISAVTMTTVPHRNTEDITVKGYHFPKGTSKIEHLCIIVNNVI